ncbi:MAG: DUF2508 family protein [Desulfotomaculaceae bacterium]|nr:DUF2508 family protein [Desulfotomaculaceae bacterium]
MKFMSILKTIPIFELSRIREIMVVEKTSTLKLDIAVQNARKEWRQALKEMDYIDGDLAEYAIFKINAAERRYIALLNQARKEGITAWPDMEFSLAEEIHEELCTTEVKNAPA